MARAFNAQNCFAIKIGGVADHVHSLFELHRTMAIGKIVCDIKSQSSRWARCELGVRDFAWQNGYGAFSVGGSHYKAVENYIANQAAHHEKISFQDEFRSILRAYKVQFDERYLWS